MKLTKIFFVTLLLSSGLGAVKAQKIENVIQAEQSFAKLALEKDMRTAFLANMSEHSVLEANGKIVSGIPIFKNQPTDTVGKLIWGPNFAAVATSGELGYTTGPYKYSIKGKDVAFGDYATVWEKINGEWKFVIDLGNSHQQPIEQKTEPVVDKVLPDQQKKQTKSDDLVKVDSLFSQELSKEITKAYLNKLYPTSRILYSNSAPAINEVDKQKLLASVSRLSFKSVGSKIATSNDLGVVYGYCEITQNNKLQKGVYMHVWRKSSTKGWQLLHETIKTG